MGDGQVCLVLDCPIVRHRILSQQELSGGPPVLVNGKLEGGACCSAVQLAIQGSPFHQLNHPKNLHFLIPAVEQTMATHFGHLLWEQTGFPSSMLSRSLSLGHLYHL